MEFRQGAVLRGLPASARHLYDWDVPGVGASCSKCGGLRPPFTADETPCPGRAVVLVGGLEECRAHAIPPRLLAAGWARLRVEAGVQVDPAFVQASRAAFAAAFVRLGRELAAQQAALADQHARLIYQAVPSDAAPMAHSLACARVVAKLVVEGKIDALEQAALQAVAILEEAKGDGLVRSEAEQVRLASRMLLKAKELGYYR